MDKYLGLRIRSTDETLMALLVGLGADSFEEEEDFFTAYFKEDETDEAARVEIKSLLDGRKEEYEFFEVEPQNWNEVWEASFQPVTVGDFCRVRADFHPYEPGYAYDLVINPKMAFGTGHHATTWMMIDEMQKTDFRNKGVFDYGCGTGILAILASKLGAHSVDALDIEHESYLNTVENSELNQAVNVRALEGDLSVMGGATYDIILANINRNVLLESADSLKSMLHSGGRLLLSGIRPADEEVISQAFKLAGFSLLRRQEKEDWVCILLASDT